MGVRSTPILCFIKIGKMKIAIIGAGNIIPDDKLKETVITSELYYMYINSIRERLREEQKKKENTKDTDDNTM